MTEEKLIITPKRIKGDDGYKTFSIRIKEETAEEISRIANKTGHSRNELICRFLEYALANCTIKDKDE